MNKYIELLDERIKDNEKKRNESTNRINISTLVSIINELKALRQDFIEVIPIHKPKATFNKMILTEQDVEQYLQTGTKKTEKGGIKF